LVKAVMVINRVEYETVNVAFDRLVVYCLIHKIVSTVDLACVHQSCFNVFGG